MSSSFVIGIAGGSGSGKSTLVRLLSAGEHGPEMSVLRHDSYYLSGSRMPTNLRSETNYDHPDALDNALFVEHVDRLRAGRAVDQPVYDFGTHARDARVERVDARPVVLLEGLLLFAVPEVRDRIDLRVYVDTPPDERLARRILRDVVERGRTVESVVMQFRKTVRPMHYLFVEPSRYYAHIVVPWDGEGANQVAVDVVTARIGRAIANRGPA